MTAIQTLYYFVRQWTDVGSRLPRLRSFNNIPSSGGQNLAVLSADDDIPYLRAARHAGAFLAVYFTRDLFSFFIPYLFLPSLFPPPHSVPPFLPSSTHFIFLFLLSYDSFVRVHPGGLLYRLGALLADAYN
jgi:hypothetical protein